MITRDELTVFAAACLQKDELPGCEAAAEAAIALEPAHHPSWVLLATSLAKQNKHERAVACFERAVQLDPKDVASHTSLGELYIELGAYTRAAAALKNAMELDPAAEHPSGRRARALVARTLSTLKSK